MATTLDISQLGARALPDRADGHCVVAGSASGSFCRRKPLGAFGGFIVLAMLFVALFVDARVITLGRATSRCSRRSTTTTRTFGDENESPSWDHWMGTDRAGPRHLQPHPVRRAHLGDHRLRERPHRRRRFRSASGSISGFFGGWSDTIFQRLVDVFLAIPAIILLIFALTVFARGRTESGSYDRDVSGSS